MATGGPEPERTRPRVTIARVMFWVGCAAVVLAAQRGGAQRALFVPGWIAFLALLFDLSFTITHFLFGERPQVIFFPNAPEYDRVILTARPLYAVVEGVPVRVEFVWPREEGKGPPDLIRIAEREEEGRTFLDEVGVGAAVPLDLLDRGPVLARHPVFGLCLVCPVLGAGPQERPAEGTDARPGGES